MFATFYTCIIILLICRTFANFGRNSSRILPEWAQISECRQTPVKPLSKVTGGGSFKLTGNRQVLLLWLRTASYRPPWTFFASCVTWRVDLGKGYFNIVIAQALRKTRTVFHLHNSACLTGLTHWKQLYTQWNKTCPFVTQLSQRQKYCEGEHRSV